ncbi:hypothetical protein FHU24_003665 [Clostridium saccharobutylicum]|nr:hypothetical protein [Clostridium saccharobutylicum]MBA8993894.1 hypothetical protein [Clostridium saccharobutylicum]NOV65200.1 hypothetical protein [Clostridium saccharobutylicum]NOW57107.1 hypothetical protein [Clostridium saccharobutylicum]NSB67692.1 hypothetical protein [Clostridium saccharobutylicum]
MSFIKVESSTYIIVNSFVNTALVRIQKQQDKQESSESK